MSEIFDFWFSVFGSLVDYLLNFDVGLGFSLGSLVIISLIFIVVIRYFTVLGN